MRRIVLAGTFALFATVVTSAQAPTAGRDLRLTFGPDGNVWLAARQVSLRDIMLEWARQCGCPVVNVERLSAAPIQVPLEFLGVPQSEVLAALLRQIPGYVLTPRRQTDAGPSLFGAVYLVPETSAVNSAASAMPPPQRIPPPTPGAPDDEIPPVTTIQGLVPAPQPVDPNKPVNPAGDAGAPQPQQPAPPKPPGVSVPAVRIVPVTR
jgi:hypothetical protein